MPLLAALLLSSAEPLAGTNAANPAKSEAGAESDAEAAAELDAAAAEAPGAVGLIGKHALAFVPAASDQHRPLPLLVLFHGAGGTAQDMMRPFLAEAAKRRIVLLAVQSSGPTWDLIGRHYDNHSTASRLTGSDRLPGADRTRADLAVAEVQRRVAIDPALIAAIGFSDGASFALSLGMSEPERFGWVGGLSAGFAIVPPGRPAAQRMFLAHGTQDDILPYRQARDAICPALVRSGRTVRFRSFDQGHVMSRRVIREALDDWLDPASRPPPGSSDYRCTR